MFGDHMERIYRITLEIKDTTLRLHRIKTYIKKMTIRYATNFTTSKEIF